MPTFQPPSQYDDLASQRLPTHMKSLFKWCRALFFYDETIHPLIVKLSEYPVSGMVYDPITKEEGGGLNPQTEDRWREIFEKILKIKSALISINLDRNIFGNCFVSLFYPLSVTWSANLVNKDTLLTSFMKIENTVLH